MFVCFVHVVVSQFKIDLNSRWSRILQQILFISSTLPRYVLVFIYIPTLFRIHSNCYLVLVG